MKLSGQLEELEINFWRRVIRRQLRLVVLVVAVFVVVTVSVLLVRPTSYSATTEVFVSGGDVGPEVEFIESRYVVDRVARELGYEPDISVGASATAWIMEIEARGPSPKEATRVADTYAATYAALREDAADQAWRATIAGLERTIEQTQRELIAVPEGDPDSAIPRLERDLAAYQESLASAMAGSFTETRARPVVLPGAEVRTNGGLQDLLLYGLAAAVVGLIAGFGAAAIRQGLDPRVDGPGGAAQALRAPLLGTTRSADERLYSPPVGWRRRSRNLGYDRLLVEPGSSEAEAIGLVRTRLLPMESKKPRGAVQVCGVETGDQVDAASVAVNLARSFALANVPTALVWADFRHNADILGVLGVDPTGRGLADVVAGETSMTDVLTQPADVPSLWVLTPGSAPASIVDFYSGPSFKQFMEDVVAFVDVIVVHTPPLAEHADGQLVAQRVDASVVVVNGSTARRGPLEAAEEDLRSVGVRIEGVVYAGPTAP